MTTEQYPEVSFLDDSAKIPSPQQPLEERILFIQENMVSFVKQYNMPIVEVALVISKYIRILLEKLQEIANDSENVLSSISHGSINMSQQNVGTKLQTCKRCTSSLLQKNINNIISNLDRILEAYDSPTQ